MTNPLDELIAAALDACEQMGMVIDLDTSIDDPSEHDLYDVLQALQKAVAAFDRWEPVEPVEQIETAQHAES